MPAHAYALESSRWPSSVCESGSHYGAETETPLSSAQRLHKRIKKLHAHGNRVRSELIAALRCLHEERTYRLLGYTELAQYCQMELGIAKSTAYEWIRTGILLDRLPGVRSLHEGGDLSWEQTREIAKVATPQHEREWVEFAMEHSVRELRAEVKDALTGDRERPRSREHGLPNVTTRLVLDLTREERERLETALRIVAESRPRDGEPEEFGIGDVSIKDSLMHLVDELLAGRIEAAGADSAAGRTRQAVVYQHCPECSESTVGTAEGPVRVDSARIDELLPVSERVEIDPAETLEVAPLPSGETDSPNTAQLVRKVLHRDGMRCASPGCGSRHQLQAHHVIFRENGGRTILANEVAVCSRCHALIHEGLLEVSGSARRGRIDLEWMPHCRKNTESSLRKLDRVWSELQSQSVAHSAAQSAARNPEASWSPKRQRVPQVCRADSAGLDRVGLDGLGLDGLGVDGLGVGEVGIEKIEIETSGLLRALVKMGFDKSEAEQTIERAERTLHRRDAIVDEESLLRQIFASKRERNRQ